MAFQTFLLDKDNKVLAMGNPILNPKIKELYLKIIRGNDIVSTAGKGITQTKVHIDVSFLHLTLLKHRLPQESACLENIPLPHQHLH